MSEGGPLGYLVINVLEAAGHDSDDAVVWEPEFKQGYARGARPWGALLWRQACTHRAPPRCCCRFPCKLLLVLLLVQMLLLRVFAACPCCRSCCRPSCAAVEIRGGAKTIKVRPLMGRGSRGMA